MGERSELRATETGLHPARGRLALALDVASADDARVLLRALRPWFGIAKVGLELFTAAGPAVIAVARDEGFAVFADLKLHDIPTTVGRAAHVIGRTGARYLTVHAAGGEPMLVAAVEGFTAGALAAGHEPPTILAVTVLTSDPVAGEVGSATLDERVGFALAAGCPGLVCSTPDLPRARALHPGATIVCPGVRPAGGVVHDQARVGTPAEAARAGADILVIGRAVTAADHPAHVAAAIAEEVAGAARQT